MTITLLFVLPIVVIPVGVDAESLEVDDPEVLRYEVVVLSASDYLDESLVVDLLETKLRAGGITPVRLSPSGRWIGPSLEVWVQPLSFEGWAYNIQLLRNVSCQARGQTLREYAATFIEYWPTVWPFVRLMV